GAVLQALQQPAGVGGQLVMEAGAADEFQGGQTGGHGQRVARQGADLVDRTQRRDVLHDLPRSYASAHRHAAAVDLAQGGQIWGHAEIGLSTVQCYAETVHHLVDDQHYTVFFTGLAQAFEEARRWRYVVHVAGHRFDVDAG